MRCTCCNKNLNDFEATRKHALTGEYLDMCNGCIKDLNIPTKERRDLLTESDCHEGDNEGVDKDTEMCYPPFKDNYEDS